MDNSYSLQKPIDIMNPWLDRLTSGLSWRQMITEHLDDKDPFYYNPNGMLVGCFFSVAGGKLEDSYLESGLMDCVNDNLD